MKPIQRTTTILLSNLDPAAAFKQRDMIEPKKGTVGQPQNHTPVTRAKKLAFIEHLAQTGVVTPAAAAVGVNRHDIYRHREQDPAFAEAWDDALVRFGDKIEGIALDRAANGHIEQAVSAGQVFDLRKIDNRLLETILKAKKSQEYREKLTIEHDISDRLAQRLEAAGRRMITTEEPVTIEGEVSTE